jgi:hypothetical protein
MMKFIQGLILYLLGAATIVLTLCGCEDGTLFLLSKAVAAVLGYLWYLLSRRWSDNWLMRG